MILYFYSWFILPDGVVSLTPSEGDPQVFISYQWDMQGKVEDIKQLLENNNLLCWADVSMTVPPRGHSSKSSRSGVGHHDGGSETLQSQIQRNMKAASVVLSCITPKYLQSDNCKKDLTLAETFNKPVIPVLLRFSPQENAPEQVRKILAKFSYIDISNERLYRQNIPLVLEKVKKAVNQRTGYWGHHHDNKILQHFFTVSILYRTTPMCASVSWYRGFGGVSLYPMFRHVYPLPNIKILLTCTFISYNDLYLSVWVTFELFIRDLSLLMSVVGCSSRKVSFFCTLFLFE